MKGASRAVDVGMQLRPPLSRRQPIFESDRVGRLPSQVALRYRSATNRVDFQQFDEREIRRVARQRGPSDSILVICARMAWHEARLRFERRINFRREVNLEACQAYCTMQLDEFAAINSRQAWANWRTIPRNLSRRLPSRPVFAVDPRSPEFFSRALRPGLHYLPLSVADKCNETVAQVRQRELTES